MKHYSCLPEKCGCDDDSPCHFDSIDEEYLMDMRRNVCNIALENLYIVDEDTGNQVYPVMEW